MTVAVCTSIDELDFDMVSARCNATYGQARDRPNLHFISYTTGTTDISRCESHAIFYIFHINASVFQECILAFFITYVCRHVISTLILILCQLPLNRIS